MRIFCLASLVFVLPGCAYAWQADVIKQASFDHKCPAESISVVANTDDSQSRTADLKICGKDRRYRDLGGRYVTWVDITDGVPAAAAPR